MKYKNVMYLPSGRVFIFDLDGYVIESTEMRDVSISGKNHIEVRESSDPHVIWKHIVPYEKKWLITVSTQKGCTHNCKFCDVANLPFRGNLTRYEINEQIREILKATPYVNRSEKVKIGYARMGEPSHNIDAVLGSITDLKRISIEQSRTFNWLPCFNSILPRKTLSGISGFDVIDRVLDVKEKHYNGFLHFQISCNSTSEEKRKELFGNGGNVLTIDEIVNHVNKQTVTNRTVTLNFIVMDGIEVDVEKLKKLGLNGNKFTVKLIPLNKTNASNDNKLKTYANYSNYQKLLDLKKKFEYNGVPVVVDAIAKCEEAGLCCGQLAQIFQ